MNSHNPPEVCLYQPEIPQNTGNIGRLCAATQTKLHLIEPLGFSLSEKQVRRAGLDYWPYLKLQTHSHIDTLLANYPEKKTAFLSTKARQGYDKIPEDCELIVFGRETAGLPESLQQKFSDQFYKIPLFHPKVRSLNLANAVAIVLYHLITKKQNISL